MFNSPDAIGRHEKLALHDIDDDIVRNDVRRYLVEQFAGMRLGARDLGVLPEDWPSGEDLNKLLDRCGKFFAYAALLIEFIGARDAVGRLDRFLCLEYVDGAGPYLELDNLYKRILRRVNAWLSFSAEDIQIVIATVMLLRDPLSTGDLAVFLFYVVGRCSQHAERSPFCGNRPG